MDVWVIRAGKIGEREEWCFTNGYAGGGFNNIDDLSSCASRDDIKSVYRRSRPTDSDGRVNTNSAQLWLLRGRVKVGDLVVLPLKGGVKKIAIGKCTGTYTYLADEVVSQRHIVKVDWEKTDIPRSAIKQDLLYILGSALSFFNPKKNDAAWRIEKILATGVDPGSRAASGNTERTMVAEDDDEIEEEGIDVVEAARDVIRAFVIENFKGHKLAELTAAILEARGLTCVVSPPGPDKGIDILAGSGPLGLDEPRIVVQCKSEVSPVGSDIFQKLLGAVAGVAGAQQGLLVAFGGLNGPAKKELSSHRFRVSVWDTDELIDNLLDVFENLNEDIASEIPLQRVWTLSPGLE